MAIAKQTESSSPDVFLSALASVVLHLLLLVCLGVIGFQSASGVPVHVIRAERTDDAATTIIESFQLRSPTPPIPAEANTSEDRETEWLMDVDIDLSRLAVLPNPDSVEADQQTSATEEGETAQTLAASNALASASDQIQRKVRSAGGRTGEVQFALSWANVNDVDLHVIAPSGERISHLHKISRCGGELDVDMNVRGESDSPIENVRWLVNAPAGRYTVLINLFRLHRSPQQARVFAGSRITLLTKLGEATTVHEELVSRNDQLAVLRFVYLPQADNQAEQRRGEQEWQDVQGREEAVATTLLAAAKDIKTQRLRDQRLGHLIGRYPHTDAAIAAMRLLGGQIKKTGL